MCVDDMVDFLRRRVFVLLRSERDRKVIMIFCVMMVCMSLLESF